MTVPVPVTVIRPDPVAEVNAAVRVPGGGCPPAGGLDGAPPPDASPDTLPSANAPIRTAAALTPMANARKLGVNVTGMATPVCQRVMCPM